MGDVSALMVMCFLPPALMLVLIIAVVVLVVALCSGPWLAVLLTSLGLIAAIIVLLWLASR